MKRKYIKPHTECMKMEIDVVMADGSPNPPGISKDPAWEEGCAKENDGRELWDWDYDDDDSDDDIRR